MLLLAADTSGKHGSIALAQCQPGDECNIVEVVALAGGTFSAQLVPQIAELLQKHGFTKRDIGGFAVASGPGSFTGLRVGLAAIKALADVLGKPIAAVSLLEAVAATAPRADRVLAALDAGRGEVYVGDYETRQGKVRCRSERLLAMQEFTVDARGRLVATPDEPMAEKAQAAGLQVVDVERPRSDAIARLGWGKIQAGETISAEDLEANYIRRSDAEIFSNPTSR